MDYLRRNNGDGRYNGLLQHLENLAQPKLSDVATFIRHAPNDAHDKVKKLINGQNSTSADKLLDLINKLNQKNGKYNPLLKKFEGRKNLGLIDFLKPLLENKETYSSLLNFLDNPAPIDHVIEYMQKNNNGGVYDGILNQLKNVKNPKKTDLLQVMMNFEKKVDLGEVKKQLEDEHTSELLDFLKRKNFNNQFGQSIEKLQSNPSLLEFFKFVTQNKKGLNYRPIFSKINGEEDDEPSPKTQLDKHLSALQGEPQVNSIRENLLRLRSPLFTQEMEMVLRSPGNEALLSKLNEVPVIEQFDHLSNYLQLNPQNPDFFEIR